MRSIILGIFAVMLSASFVLAVVGGGDVVYKVKRVGDVTFSHDTHGKDYGFKCEECHPAVFPMEKGKKRTMTEMRKKQACGVCHNGKNAFDVADNCFVCHKK